MDNKKYKDTTSSKIWNLKDKKNPELRQNVVEGIIGEEEFAGMSSEVCIYLFIYLHFFVFHFLIT